MVDGGGPYLGNVLTVDEEKEYERLTEVLTVVLPISNVLDKWHWRLNNFHLFSVKSCYHYLMNLAQFHAIEQSVFDAIAEIWKLFIPSKVRVFGWKL